MNGLDLKRWTVALLLSASIGYGAPALDKAEKSVPDAAETLVTTLSKEQIREFSTLVNNRNLRREEVAVVLRIGEEKQRERKSLLDVMQKEYEMKPECVYLFEAESKTLYQLVTNKLDKTGKPERKVFHKIKTGGEAKYVSRLMMARRMTENQIQVLAQLRAEKVKEAQLMDAKLRQTFKLDPDAGYRLDKKTGKVFRQPSAKKPEDGIKAGAAAQSVGAGVGASPNN